MALNQKNYEHLACMKPKLSRATASVAARFLSQTPFEAITHESVSHDVDREDSPADVSGVVIPSPMPTTDREQFIAILERRHIKFCESTELVSSGIGKFTIEVEGGYTGFFTLFEFDLAGKLLTIGAFE